MKGNCLAKLVFYWYILCFICKIFVATFNKAVGTFNKAEKALLNVKVVVPFFVATFNKAEKALLNVKVTVPLFKVTVLR
jgi:hypothetical protein